MLRCNSGDPSNTGGIPLLFRDGRTMGKDKIVEFQVNGANSSLRLWEVTNPLSPVQQSFQFANGQLTFRIKSDSLRSFILFDPQSKYPEVTKTEVIKILIYNMLTLLNFDFYPSGFPGSGRTLGPVPPIYG